MSDRTYLDPSLVAGRYPSSSKPTLPATFVVPDDVRAANSNVAGAAVGVAVAAIAGGAMLWWAFTPRQAGRRRR